MLSSNSGFTKSFKYSENPYGLKDKDLLMANKETIQILRNLLRLQLVSSDKEVDLTE